MKHLTVLIRAELEIPDDWEVVEHPSGVQALKIGDRFVAFDFAPFTTRSADTEAEWSDTETGFIGTVVDAVVGMEAELEIKLRH